MSGVGPQQLHYVLGVAKAYATRVGSGPFPTELDDEVGEHLRVRGNEYGSVTGRPRRCGWFDAAGLRRVVEINGISGLCITKLDVLDGLDTVRVAVGYKVRGERRDLLPVGADALAICAPIYEEHAGLEGKHGRREVVRRAAEERAGLSAASRSAGRRADRDHLDRSGSRWKRSSCSIRSTEDVGAKAPDLPLSSERQPVANG